MAVTAAATSGVPLTTVVELLTALVLGFSMIGGGIKAISKLTRIADSVDRLSRSMEHVVGQIGDHEKRIDRLEHHDDH